MAREAARATECKNNMRQIGLALHNYHDIHKRLPPGWAAPGVDPEGPNGWGWASSILAEMEQRNLQETIRYHLPISDPINQPARQFVVSSYICPSDVLNPTFEIHGGPSVYRRQSELCGRLRHVRDRRPA
jgi:hypothetical protein